jgi:hypothetical protein
LIQELSNAHLPVPFSAAEFSSCPLFREQTSAFLQKEVLQGISSLIYRFALVIYD